MMSLPRMRTFCRLTFILLVLRTPQVKGKLEYIARGVLNLMGHALGGQNVWAILETTALDPAVRVMPTQVRAEVWMAPDPWREGDRLFRARIQTDLPRRCNFPLSGRRARGDEDQRTHPVARARSKQPGCFWENIGAI